MSMEYTLCVAVFPDFSRDITDHLHGIVKIPTRKERIILG